MCRNSAQVNAEGLCPWCNRFANLSAQIQNQSIYLVHSTPRPGAFALPGIRGSKRFLSFSNGSALCADAVRSYTKNRLALPLLELWNALLSFAPYGGIGIKTALGMGGVSVEPLAPPQRSL